MTLKATLGGLKGSLYRFRWVSPKVRVPDNLAVGRHSGMGAIPHEKGVAFRVWAPHAEAVSVVGTFNEWDAAKHPMTRENPEGYWYADVANAKIGSEYRYHLVTVRGALSRIDP